MNSATLWLHFEEENFGLKIPQLPANKWHISAQTSWSLTYGGAPVLSQDFPCARHGKLSSYSQHQLLWITALRNLWFENKQSPTKPVYDCSARNRAGSGFLSCQWISRSKLLKVLPPYSKVLDKLLHPCFSSAKVGMSSTLKGHS